MKKQAIKDKALGMYINNESISNISKTLKIGLRTVRTWKIKYNWQEAREKAIQKGVEKSPEIYSQIVKEQVNITSLANKELLFRLERQDKSRKEINQIKGRIYNKLIEIGKENDGEKKAKLNIELKTLVDLLNKLYTDLIQDKDLISIEKHGLEVVRPKQQNQFNFMKKEVNMNVNIVEVLKAIRNGEGL